VIDRELEARMDIAQRLSSLVLSLRRKVNIKVRQPLSRIMVPVIDSDFRHRLEEIKHLVLAEVNVKEVEYVTEAGVFVKKIKPDFKALGARLGKLMKGAAAAINTFSQEQIAALEASGKAEVTVDGETVTIDRSEVEITANDIPGWQVATDGKLTVALDTTITAELKEEGIARELVNRIQNIRKDKAFEVTDRITVQIAGNNLVKNAVNKNKQYICSETLAASLELVDEIPSNDAVFVEVDDEVQTHVFINKLN
jgi:isoleucyl-tRNA synthetase